MDFEVMREIVVLRANQEIIRPDANEPFAKLLAQYIEISAKVTALFLDEYHHQAMMQSRD